MKVLHILRGNEMFGAEKIAYKIVKYLKNDFKNICVCGGSPLADEFKKMEIDTYTISYKFYDFMKSIGDLRRILNTHNVDIIHAHDNTASLIGYLAKKKDQILISHIHSEYRWLQELNLKKIIDKIFRKKYDFNIFCSDNSYKYYRKYSNDIKKYDILINAIDLNIKYSRKNIRSIYNIPEEAICFGYVGRLEENKGLIELVDEIIEKEDYFLKDYFMFVGTGTIEDDLKNIITKSNRIVNNFKFTGYQENIHDYLGAMDIFIFPSKYEGLPLAILEAGLEGKLIISTKVGEVPKILANDRGILVNNNDYCNFVNRIINVKSNMDNYKIHGENLKEYIISRYGMEIYINKVSDIYKLLLKSEVN